MYPFEATFEDLTANIDDYVTVTMSTLQSGFLVMPKGDGFIEYSVFETAYEALKRVTKSFSIWDKDAISALISLHPVTFVVVRSILGFTPSEWAYVTTDLTSVNVSQNAARSIDRRIRVNPSSSLPNSGLTAVRISAMVEAATLLLQEGAPQVNETQIHRLDKVDTRNARVGIGDLAGIGVPYAMLLYERFLGRPFAGHRDSVSELVGDVLETAIEEKLARSGVSFRKTKRAKRVAGFDQAPDFIIPSEFNPQVVIEAKITEDDGTARDKVTRVQHLASISMGPFGNQPRFQVVACIGGRGFRQRREDMKKLLLATKGKVFTVHTLDYLVSHTRLQEFQTK